MIWSIVVHIAVIASVVMLVYNTFRLHRQRVSRDQAIFDVAFLVCYLIVLMRALGRW